MSPPGATRVAAKDSSRRGDGRLRASRNYWHRV